MKTLKKYSVEIPDYALSYIVMDDASGLTEEDKSNIDSFLNPFYQEAETLGGHVLINLDYDSESHFTWNPPFGLACNVLDFTILILE